MKSKKLKLMVGALVVMMMGATLTGCGGNKLVATKEVEATEETAKHTEEIEVSFKNDKIDNVKMTFIFENADTAKKYVDDYNAMIEMLQKLDEESKTNIPKLTQKGKKAIMELDAKTFAEMAGNEEEVNMTKEELRKSLEEDGYKVK